MSDYGINVYGGGEKELNISGQRKIFGGSVRNKGTYFTASLNINSKWVNSPPVSLPDVNIPSPPNEREYWEGVDDKSVGFEVTLKVIPHNLGFKPAFISIIDGKIVGEVRKRATYLYYRDYSYYKSGNYFSPNNHDWVYTHSNPVNQSDGASDEIWGYFVSPVVSDNLTFSAGSGFRSIDFSLGGEMRQFFNLDFLSGEIIVEPDESNFYIKWKSKVSAYGKTVSNAYYVNDGYVFHVINQTRAKLYFWIALVSGRLDVTIVASPYDLIKDE